MTIADDIVAEIFKQNKTLPDVLSKGIKQRLGMSIGEFSERSGIPASTLYKILLASGIRCGNATSEKREPPVNGTTP
jgi:predicted transcriptional regulator